LGDSDALPCDKGKVIINRAIGGTTNIRAQPFCTARVMSADLKNESGEVVGIKNEEQCPCYIVSRTRRPFILE